MSDAPLRQFAETIARTWAEANDDGSFLDHVRTRHEILGYGCAGVVVRAHAHALKVYRPGTDTLWRQARECIERVASHPCVISILDAGSLPENGSGFLVMPIADGVLLRDWKPRSLEAVRAFADWIRDVVLALRDADVHHSLGPGNIIVRADGLPCLIDSFAPDGHERWGDWGSFHWDVVRRPYRAIRAPEREADAWLEDLLRELGFSDGYRWARDVADDLGRATKRDYHARLFHGVGRVDFDDFLALEAR